MKIDKLNDWVKALGAQLVAGIFTIIFLEIYYVTEAPIDMYLLLLADVLMVVYYVFAGIFLRNVMAYKLILLWGALFAIAAFTPYYAGLLMSGGVMMFAGIFYHFTDDVMKHIAYSFPISVFSPFIITYISMKIARHREEKLRPYLEEIMAKNDAENC